MEENIKIIDILIIHTYVYITESLCYTTETNMILSINYISIKFK